MSIVEEWSTVEAPKAPALKGVRVKPEESCLLVLDIQYNNCNTDRRPRCVATLPRVSALLERARSWGLTVVHSTTRGASAESIREEVQPARGEEIVSSSVDKFHGTDLGPMLQRKGIGTVIVTGTSAHGAVLHTATGAALRDLRVVVPVDCLSADDPYPEQYAAWHLANAPGTRRHVILTKVEMIETLS